jgi:hypothetical protein
MAGPREQSSGAPVKDTIGGLVREDLMNRPHESISEGTCSGEAGGEENEFDPREETTEPSGTAAVTVEALGPVKVEEVDTGSRSPKPHQREARVVHELEPLRSEMAVEQAEIRIPRRDRKARDLPDPRCFSVCALIYGLVH